ncbi:uncharacterized protein [Palaemon carinicauda]|uniref:uncharacterized protein n=1 Tax=Palaemon carinicauda TaxID=392227 RepID=UPI0035B62310
MEGYYALLWLVILTTVVASQSSRHESDNHLEWSPSLNLDDLRQLILEGDVSAFENEARSFREGQPNLADLSAMANDVFLGVVPQYIRDNNYTILPSMHGGSSDVNASSPFYQVCNSYFKMQTEGDIGTASVFDFYNVSGTVGSYSYVIGNGFHSFARYAKVEGSIEFEVSTLGAFLSKLPNGIFALIGNYTGVSQGNSVQSTEGVAQASAYTLGSLNTGYYASRNIMLQNGTFSHGNTQQHVNSFSVTGGTNCTMELLYGSADLNNTVWMNVTGTLQNPDKESTLNATYEVSPTANMSYLASEDFALQSLFMTRFGAEVYLV